MRFGCGKLKIGMKMLVSASTVFILFILSIHLVQAQAPSQRVIVGQISNATENADPVSGLTVTLHRQDQETYEEGDTKTEDSGKFEFRDMLMDEQSLYGVTVRYGGVVYGADINPLRDLVQPIMIKIYETSDDQSLLEVRTASLLLARADKLDERVHALEIVNVVNTGDRTYVPGPEPMNLLRFALPVGSSDLQVDTQLIAADALQVDRGFALTANVPPGEHEVLFSYNFPYDNGSVTFDKSYPYGTESLRVVSPNDLGALSSPHLPSPTSKDIGGSQYQVIETVGVERDTRVTIHLTGLPRAVFWDHVIHRVKTMPYELVAPVALGVLMLAILSFVLLYRKRQILGGSTMAVQPQRMELIRRLDDLEDERNRSQISEETYGRVRRQLVSRLVALKMECD